MLLSAILVWCVSDILIPCTRGTGLFFLGGEPRALGVVPHFTHAFVRKYANPGGRSDGLSHLILSNRITAWLIFHLIRLIFPIMSEIGPHLSGASPSDWTLPLRTLSDLRPRPCEAPASSPGVANNSEFHNSSRKATIREKSFPFWQFNSAN